MTNTRHQTATHTRQRTIAELRATIRTQLQQLHEHTGYLDDLASTRQTIGTTGMSADDQAARRRQEAADRAAALGHAPRDGRVGLRWLNADTAATSAGQVAAPVSIAAVSTAAQIRTTLQRWLARLAKPARLAAQHAPRPVTAAVARLQALQVHVDDQGIRHLAEHLDAIVAIYDHRPTLEAILRDLDQLDTKATDVIDGPSRTRHPDVCPWCGEHSLVIYNRAPGRAAAYIRCEGTHPCQCPDEWCPCHRPNSRHRHEWENSRHATHTWNRLNAEQNHRRDEMTAETIARTTLDQVRALHARMDLYPWDHECDNPEQHADDFHIETEDTSGHVCIQCPPTGSACATCRDDDGNPHPWPCPTAQLIDQDLTTGDHP